MSELVEDPLPVFCEAPMFKRAMGAGGFTAMVWRDDYRGAKRVCRYRGDCIVCGRRCWSFDDGENDPRGALGDHALHVVYADLDDGGGEEYELRACAECGNDHRGHREALFLARKHRRDGGDLRKLGPL